MGLSMAERKAATKQMAKRYEKATKAQKGRMLDELCALTGWTRRHTRRALQVRRNRRRQVYRKIERARRRLESA